VVDLEFEGQQNIVVKFWGFSPKVVKYLTLVRMALFVPRFRMAKISCSAFFPADIKLKVRTLIKCQSLNILLILHKFHEQIDIFCLNLFRPAVKIDEDYAPVHLVLVLINKI
jgi:hypothetical protein